MKSLSPLFASGLLVAALTGCTTTHASVMSTPLTTSCQSNLKADVAVSQRISGESTTVTLLGLFNFGDGEYADGVNYPVNNQSIFHCGTVEDTKSSAAYHAIKDSKADLIVAPRYEVKETNYLLFRVTEATVTGEKGIIKSIHE